MSEEMEKLEPKTMIAGVDNAQIVDFWSWAYSDILSNRNRAIKYESPCYFTWAFYYLPTGLTKKSVGSSIFKVADISYRYIG